MMNIDNIKRAGKFLMGSSDLSLVIYEQKCQHEAQAKTLPFLSKASTALLKWSYTESNAHIPNLYSCWSDLDHAYQMLLQETIDQSVEYRKVFKDINAEGKKLNDIQKEKEGSAKKVTAIKKQIESLRKSKKQADKVKLGNLEAELLLAQNKDSETGRLLITKTKEFEECKSKMLRESSLTYCDKSLEALEKIREVFVAKREVASIMSQSPVYNGDRISRDGMTTVDDVFQSLQLQLPLREPTLDRTRCFTLGTRSSSFMSNSPDVLSTSSQPTTSPRPGRAPPRASPPSIPSNSPALKASTLPRASTAGSQDSEEVSFSDDSDSDDHDYQIPTEDMISRRHTRQEEQEEEYLAPEFSEPPTQGPRVPPRQESMQNSDSSGGTSHIPGDYMEVIEGMSDHEEPRMPPASETSRISTDSNGSNTSNNSSSSGLSKGIVKLPRVLPSSTSLEVTDSEQMLKRKPAPLPKPDPKPKPNLKPKPKARPSPGPIRAKPNPLPRTPSNEQDGQLDSTQDSGGFYEIMIAADPSKSGMGNDSVSSPSEPTSPTAYEGTYYSDVYERDDEDSEGDYCVAGPLPGLPAEELASTDGYTPLITGTRTVDLTHKDSCENLSPAADRR